MSGGGLVSGGGGGGGFCLCLGLISSGCGMNCSWKCWFAAEMGDCVGDFKEALPGDNCCCEDGEHDVGGEDGLEGETGLPCLVSSTVRSFLETEVLNLSRLEPNSRDKKFPSCPSFCFCLDLLVEVVAVSSPDICSDISADKEQSRYMLSKLLDLFLTPGTLSSGS